MKILHRNRAGGQKRIGILTMNVILILCIVLDFLFYGYDNRQKLRDQNLSNVQNINASAARIASSFFLNQQKRLLDIAQFAGKRSLSLSETLQYICDSNADSGSTFEIVGTDSGGFAAVAEAASFRKVSYTNSNYLNNLTPIFENAGSGMGTGIRCTPEFTDSLTKFKSFALYIYVSLDDADGTENSYTLMDVSKSQDFSALMELDEEYAGLSTVLMNADGDYLFGSSEFKSDNLFTYFYTFSDLTLDQKNAAMAEFSASGGSGCFYFKDSHGRDCVYVYSHVPQTEWTSVTCVPLGSFHSVGPDYQFTAVAMLLLVLLMIIDLFWLNSINRELKESARKEREASAAKTDFLSRMSHDIRTPLNVIIGSGYLAQKCSNPPSTQKYLEDIDISGKYLLSLVNDILDLNKVESGKMELFPAPYTYRELKTNISAVIAPLCSEKEIEFSIVGNENGPAYLLDKIRVNQILCNILSNSVKFTPRGGHISLVCGAEPPQNGIAQIIFTAADDGKGMSEEFQKTMFDAFTQENADSVQTGQGTGLGLAIVHNLVLLMGGTVSVKSAPGMGTVFQIRMSAPVTERQESAPVGPAEYESLRGKRILLCEDHPLNAEIAIGILGNAGMLVDRAENGQVGLAMFGKSAAWYYDAVLMDVRMPVMNGIDAAKAIRALPRKDARIVPIIAMTANAYEEDVQTCLEAGMNAHTSKPIDPPVLFAVVLREIGLAERKNGGSH